MTFLPVIFLILLSFVRAVNAQDDVALERSLEAMERVEDFGYALRKAVWPENYRTIPVCWENPNDSYKSQMNLVRTSVASTWERYSGLKFNHWLECPTSNYRGIRILIANDTPHVKLLGSDLSGKRNGMVLNFDFEIDGFRLCNNSKTMYELCIRSIAVHEFGHAIALAHEHNRSDKEASCFKRSQGPDGDRELTPYDPDSVMNYCNPNYNNFGKLSYLDVLTVQELYGLP